MCKRCVKMQKLCFYRLEKEFSVLLYVFREVVALGLHVQAMPARLAGREPLSRRVSVKRFGRSSLLLFTLPIISPDCKALEVVVLCSEVLWFVPACSLGIREP